MKVFTESDKFKYPLTPESRVLDCGGFEGNWSNEIWNRYKCKIVTLEPIMEFCCDCATKLSPTGAIVLHAGLGANTRIATMRAHGGMTGMFAEGEAREVDIIGIEDLLHGRIGWKHVDLFKMNCEGSEFEILEHILEKGMAAMFGNILIQFHSCVPNAEARYEAIRDGLIKTHHLTFQELWCWENWELNK